MATLEQKIMCYLEANGKNADAEQSNMILQDDRIGGVAASYIKTWNVIGLAKPTDEELETYNDAAIARENSQNIISNRMSEYGQPRDQIENIIENGLEAEQTRVQAIKDKYPKE